MDFICIGRWGNATFNLIWLPINKPHVLLEKNSSLRVLNLKEKCSDVPEDRECLRKSILHKRHWGRPEYNAEVEKMV